MDKIIYILQFQSLCTKLVGKKEEVKEVLILQQKKSSGLLIHFTYICFMILLCISCFI